MGYFPNGAPLCDDSPEKEDSKLFCDERDVCVALFVLIVFGIPRFAGSSKQILLDRSVSDAGTGRSRDD